MNTPSQNWFSYDPGDGFEFHPNEEEAKLRCETALDHYRADAVDGWDEEVGQICYGRITNQVVMLWEKNRPDESELDEEGCDSDGMNWQDFQSLAEYGFPDSDRNFQPQPKED